MRNTSKVGSVTFTHVAAALADMGHTVLSPFCDTRRYDLVFEDEEGRFFRVQCKTGRLYRGTLSFATCSVDSRSVKGRTIRRGYRGQIDYFGVYCPANRKVYLVPVNDVPANNAFLRIDPPKNGQKTGIRWARDYEIGAVAQLGARQNGILEVTGSIPVGSTSCRTLRKCPQSFILRQLRLTEVHS